MSSRLRNKVGALGLLLILLAACGADDSTDRQRVFSTAAQPTLTLTATRTPQLTLATMPPTWTPTDTATARPPTRTPRPTATPTITPTPDVTRICEEFTVLSAPRDGVEVPSYGRIAFAWTDAPADAIVRVVIWQREIDEGILVEWPPQQAFNMAVEMDYLEDSGTYDWELSVYYEELGDLCTVKGFFVKLSEDESPSPTPTWTLTPTETPVPSLTPTAEFSLTPPTIMP